MNVVSTISLILLLNYRFQPTDNKPLIPEKNILAGHKCDSKEELEDEDSDLLTEFALEPNEESFSELNIFPNPSKGDATIEFNLFKDSKIEITLSNLHGAILAQESMELKAKLNRIQLKELYSSLKAGVYFIKISQNGISATKKVVISE